MNIEFKNLSMTLKGKLAPNGVFAEEKNLLKDEILY